MTDEELLAVIDVINHLPSALGISNSSVRTDGEDLDATSRRIKRVIVGHLQTQKRLLNFAGLDALTKTTERLRGPTLAALAMGHARILVAEAVQEWHPQ